MDLSGKTIVFQGDSITDMNREKVSKRDQNHIYGHSYVFLLAGKLSFESPETFGRIWNRGISGNRSYDLLARWQTDTLDLRPDLISVLVGINDLLFPDEHHTSPDPDGYRRTLLEIVSMTRRSLGDVPFVFCEPFGFPDPLDEHYRDLMTNGLPLYQEAMHTVAAETSSLFIPLQKPFCDAYAAHSAKGQAFWLWDGIHPTAAGHQIIAREWLRAVPG